MAKFKTEIKWGLIFVLMTLTWVLLERLAGFHDARIDKHYVITMLIFFPAVTVYFLALLDKRKNDLGGFMSYKQGVITGLIITAVVTVVSPLTQFVVSTIITPDFFDNMIAHTVEHGHKAQEEAEAYFNLRSYIVKGLIGAPVMGTVTTLILAIFTRRSPEDVEEG